MEYVANDVVKMEWEKDKWVQTKGGRFIFACKQYTNGNGETIDVCFNPWYAFVMENEEEEPLTFSDVKNMVKGGVGDDFPECYDGFVALVENWEVQEDMIELYKLEDSVDDIEARARDLGAMAEENEVEDM